MPGDLIVSITGAPYDTLAETIGIVENNLLNEDGLIVLETDDDKKVMIRKVSRL